MISKLLTFTIAILPLKKKTTKFYQIVQAVAITVKVLRFLYVNLMSASMHGHMSKQLLKLYVLLRNHFIIQD